jgi:hypothetical protein
LAATSSNTACKARGMAEKFMANFRSAISVHAGALTFIDPASRNWIVRPFPFGNNGYLRLIKKIARTFVEPSRQRMNHGKRRVGTPHLYPT